MTVEFNEDFLSGTVTSSETHVLLPEGRFTAEIVAARIIDPVAMGWVGEEVPEGDFRQMPFAEIEWQILSDGHGQPSEYAGRRVRQRVNLDKRTDPWGTPRRRHFDDLVRLKNGLDLGDAKAKRRPADAIGLSLYRIDDLQGLDRETYIAQVSQRLHESVNGLKAVVRIIHIKIHGEPVDRVAKIVEATV